jgi:acyl carrier protein
MRAALTSFVHGATPPSQRSRAVEIDSKEQVAVDCESPSQTVRRVLADITHNDVILTMSRDTSLRDDLGIDSMTSLTFLMALEDSIDNFAVDAETLEADHFRTIGTICEYVENQVALAVTV